MAESVANRTARKPRRAAHKVRLTDSFLNGLDVIEAYLDEVGTASAFDKLLLALRQTVVPNLQRFPHMGHRYLDRTPQSVEALTQLARLPRGAAESLRVYLTGDYLILYQYNAADATVFLLSIRHHRQHAFDFTLMWP